MNIPTFAWAEIEQHSDAMAATAEPRVAELLPFVQRAGEFSRRIFHHANVLSEESAQKTVALYLTIQAFRATVGTVQLSLAGYSDIAAGLARSVWEIQLRLARTRSGGELAALADQFISTDREIRLREAAKSSVEDRRVLDTWLAGRAEILAKAMALGCDEKKLRKIGNKKVFALSIEEAMKSEYDIWYSALSQMHHGGRAFATYQYLMAAVPEGGSVLLPIDDSIEAMICLVLEHLYRSITQAALLFDDSALALEVEVDHAELARVVERLLAQ